MGLWILELVPFSWSWVLSKSRGLTSPSSGGFGIRGALGCNPPRRVFLGAQRSRSEDPPLDEGSEEVLEAGVGLWVANSPVPFEAGDQ